MGGRLEPMGKATNGRGAMPQSAEITRLVDLCQEFIGYLETVEESDSGGQFHPTTIQSCRCMVVARMGEIIPEIKSICENNLAGSPAQQ